MTAMRRSALDVIDECFETDAPVPLWAATAYETAWETTTAASSLLSVAIALHGHATVVRGLHALLDGLQVALSFKPVDAASLAVVAAWLAGHADRDAVWAREEIHSADHGRESVWLLLRTAGNAPDDPTDDPTDRRARWRKNARWTLTNLENEDLGFEDDDRVAISSSLATRLRAVLPRPTLVIPNRR